MKYEKSNEIVESTLQDLKAIFLSKGAEYSINGMDDRFHHIKEMYSLINYIDLEPVGSSNTAEMIEVLRAKQGVCINELIKNLSDVNAIPESKRTKVYIDEKFNDFIMYTMLLKLLVIETYGIEVEKEV